jgi:beta-galactosidase
MVRIVDKDGNMVPVAKNLIRFRLSGPGTIVAVGNGDPTSHESFQSDRSQAFHGQCLVVVRSIEGQSGTIRLIAESETFNSGNISILSN